MSNTTTAPPNLSRPIDLIPRVLTALVGGVVIFTLLLVAVVIGFNISFAGKIYPGVSAAGIDLSGLEPEQAAALLEREIQFPNHGKILFRDGEKIWLSTPSAVGFYLDPQSTAAAAYQYGRAGDPVTRLVDRFKSWYLGTTLPPMYVFDESSAHVFLQGIAVQTDIELVEASLSVEGVDVVVRPGQTGRHLNVPATLEDLRTNLQAMHDTEIQLVIDEDAPIILNVDEQAQIARQILSKPLKLTVSGAQEGDPGPWTFEPDALAQMITIERIKDLDGERYQVGLETAGLNSFLEGISPQLELSRQNASFVFNDETRQLEVIESAVTGRSLNVAGSVEAINQKLLAGDHKIALDLEHLEPEVGDDATAEQLGITELVSSHTSYFYGSSAERIQNITTSAGQYHGLLVPPGAVLSKDEQYFVRVMIDDGSVEERPVQVGISDGVETEITRGLNQGDTVVYRQGEAKSRWRTDSSRRNLSSGRGMRMMFSGGGR